MLSKISDFFVYCYSESCFLLFFYNNHTHRATKARSTRPQKRHFKHMYFNFCFLRDTFYKIIVLKQAISSSIIALYSQKHKMLWLSLPYTTNLQYCSMFFLFFFHICSNSNCCFCVQLVKQLFFYIYKEVSGAFSNIAYFFE